MGKTKGQRIKGNVQPASSSRAAEILASSSSQLPTANLGGFAQFVGGTPFAPNPPAVGDSTTDSMAGSNMDPELVLIFKKLSKRDTTTKLKALEDLEAYLRKNEEDDFGSNGLIG
ncbi:8886_t:CDS:2, partial [Paraglomus occultum]